MKKIHSTQLNALVNKIEEFAKNNGEKTLADYELASDVLLCWISLLRKHCLTGVADELLTAVSSSIREAAAFAATGMVRSCLFSQRAQADLLLSWLYFKDHEIEYATLCRSGDGFVLKKEALSYLTTHYKCFGEKLGELNRIHTRKELDCYRLLSAHIHSQSPFVIAEVNNLEDIVRTTKLIKECIQLQSDVAEYLSDILFCTNIITLSALPDKIKKPLHSRAKSEGQKKVLFQ